MIITVTLNPSIDVSTATETITAEHKLRCEAAQRDPGGGGINVARVLKRLGADCRALYARELHGARESERARVPFRAARPATCRARMAGVPRGRGGPAAGTRFHCRERQPTRSRHLVWCARWCCLA
jgi:hypothetical protein